MVSRNTKPLLPRAFTLIELLVVVAIIALLISILLPSLNRAKRQARQVVCSTDLKSQYGAAMFYAEEYDDRIPRAMQGIDTAQYPGYHSYATCLLKYLGWNGNLGLQIRANRIVDVPGNPNILWWEAKQTYGDNDWWRVHQYVLLSVDQFQCPDFPEFEPRSDQWVHGMPLDYVASAMPIPYAELNYTYDMGANLEWEQEGGQDGVEIDLTIYKETSKLEQFPPGTSTAALIYVTEGHKTLPCKNAGPLFHHFFVGEQLPFAGRPRIANDQRHPAGINALFFDGHVQTMELHQIDVAYPNPLDKRLRWFTVIPPEFMN